ncbi:class I SAM-dependent methyltransferase [Streptomyces profundus]|uniref:class I SAM-dependent methyltransferase n=1 Tax=Streptomyces profundus TaxID=2867410 RepID=UPI002ADDBE10|nr:methyltransferase domain-containing protein [Streptomyces sp. MA3_2.13]UED83952.1 hypothetical protein K4G22_06785 [Streptomyces sp. MA3_2.13]
MRPFLPAPPVRVLDVGGGPRTHARWLLADGYEVRLIDSVPRHVEQAGRIPGCEAGLDAADGSYDVVLLLGMLYHLPDAADRRRRGPVRGVVGAQGRRAAHRHRGRRNLPLFEALLIAGWGVGRRQAPPRRRQAHRS